MVKSLLLTDIEDGIRCNVELVTLEEHTYHLEWTVQNGLEMKKVDWIAVSEGDDETSYEDLN